MKTGGFGWQGVLRGFATRFGGENHGPADAEVIAPIVAEMDDPDTGGFDALATGRMAADGGSGPRWARMNEGGPGRQGGGDTAQSGNDAAAAPVTDTGAFDYSDEALEELLYMLEEEKLAGDIYEAFYEIYGLPVFDNIAASEDRHYQAVLDQAEKIGVDVDEFVLQPAGTFVNEELQEMYDTLLAQGSESREAAIGVGIAIEEKDIVDIAAAAEMVEGSPLAQVYENLLTGSYYHLEAFEALL